MASVEKIPFHSCAGKDLYLTLWQGDGRRNVVVQLVHGMAEHIARYDALAQALCDAGYTVAGHSHLGHGPEAKEKDLGYFAAKKGWDCVIEDIKTAHDLLSERFPGARHVLLGHSMGSFAAREYMIRYGYTLDGCVISGTGAQPAALCTAGQVMAVLCGVLGGWKKPARLVDSIAFGGNNKAFAPARTPCDWLSRDEKEVDKYVADPLCGFMFTARAYYDMFGGIKALAKEKRLQQTPSDLPVYMISGDKDPVGANGAGVKAVYEQFKKAGMQDVTLRLYPNGRHEMFNETNRGEVYCDLIAWLSSHVK